MIERTAIYLIHCLATHSSKHIDKDDFEIYVYGLECFFNTLIPTLFLFIWSILSNTTIETFIWIISFSHLRNYTGGYHAPNQISCILTTILLGICNTFFIRHVEIPFCFHISLYTLLCLILIVLCPVKSLQKPNDLNKTKRKFHIFYTLILYASLLPHKIGLSILYTTIITLILVIAQYVKLVYTKVKE